MNAALDIYSLGGLRIRLEHAPLTGLRSRTAEALLVYLVCQGRPLSREWLAEFFWPERPAETSQANLRVTLHRLQQKLSPYLSVMRQTVSLRDDNLPYLDSADFERLLGARQLREALSLYHGDFLSGFYLAGRPAFETWAASERARLRDRALATYQELLSQHIAKAQTEEAIRLARGLLDLEPLHEPTLRLLLRLLAQGGRRQAAIESFDRYRKLLLDELGLEPDETTLALLQRIKQGSEEEISPDNLTLAPSPAVQLNVPLTTALLGRQRELVSLQDRLTNKDCRLLTLTGPGGIGKTRLASEAMLLAAPSFPDGVCFVALAGVSAAEAILPTLVQSLELTLPPSSAPMAGLLAYLRNKRMLLVFDNFEHVLSGAPFLLELLRHAPEVKLLVTSRERLALFEEWLLPLSGLKVDEAALELFVQRAQRVAPEAKLEGNETPIREICRLVEGFPLAIELAASWAGVMTCESILREIQVSLDFLKANMRDLPERHRSVRGLFDASWNLLTAEEQAVFRRLAVFRGGFTAAEAGAVTGASLEGLRALTEKSLLRADGRGRFELHELIRQYAVERLALAGEETVTAQQHFRAFLTLAEEAEPHMFASEQPKWLKRLEPEWNNFRAALLWGFNGGQGTATLVRMLEALAWVWLRRDAAEAHSWLAKGVQLEGLTTRQRAGFLHHLGHVAWIKGELVSAEAQLRGTLELWEELGMADSQEAARTQSSLAMTRYMQREAQEARRLLEAALGVFRREGSAWWTAFSLGWLAKIAITLRDYNAAKEPLEECLDIYRRLGNLWGLGLFLHSAAQLHYDSGDLLAARKFAEESLTLLKEVGHKHALGEVYRSLGAIAAAEQLYREAELHYRQSIALYRDIGQETLAGYVTAELERCAQIDASEPHSRPERNRD